jgi:superfamily II DNA or RNA helicase
MVEISEKDGELGLIVYAKGEPDLFDQGYIFNFELVFVLTFNIDGRIYIRNLTKYSHESPFKHLTDIKLQSHHYINLPEIFKQFIMTTPELTYKIWKWL